MMKSKMKNNLNDLSSSEWIRDTKSVWFSTPPQRDKLKSQHPATYAESDIERLICFFTKKGEKILDPFVGVGSTLIACHNTERNGIGVELVDKWVEIAKNRINKFTSQRKITGDVIKTTQFVESGDARLILKSFINEEVDFIVTSPPYWKILRRAADHKSKRERIGKGLDTTYSNDKRDLGNLKSYNDFLKELSKVFSECYRILKNKKYMAVIVSDFRKNSELIMYHADIADIVKKVGFTLKSVNVLIQNNKTLYPYGYPYDYVPNIHHQNILIFRKG